MKVTRMSRPRVFEYIEAVARLRSIRRAAEALNVASSAVNRMILDYERELGTPIFERLPRGVRPTTAGEYLLAHIHRSRMDLETVQSQIDALRGLGRGHVQIAAIEAATPFVAAQLGHFHMSHRLISYSVQVMGSPQVLSAVQQDQVELGLAINVKPTRQIAIAATQSYRLHAFVGVDHPLAQRESVRLNDCVGYPVAMGDNTMGGRPMLEAAFGALLLDCRPFLTSNSFDLMIAAGRYTDAITFQFLPGRNQFVREAVTAVPVDDPHMQPAELSLVVNPRRPLPVAGALLVDVLAKAMAEGG